MGARNTINHYDEFFKLLHLRSDHGSDKVFSRIDIFSNFSHTDEQNIRYFLQLYGDYIADAVKAHLPNRRYPLNASIRAFPMLRSYKQRHQLYFSAVITINDEWYEIILVKRVFVAGIIAKSESGFNRKTRQLILDTIARLNALGTDRDRRIGIPLPVA